MRSRKSLTPESVPYPKDDFGEEIFHFGASSFDHLAELAGGVLPDVHGIFGFREAPRGSAYRGIELRIRALFQDKTTAPVASTTLGVVRIRVPPSASTRRISNAMHGIVQEVFKDFAGQDSSKLAVGVGIAVFFSIE